MGWCCFLSPASQALSVEWYDKDDPTGQWPNLLLGRRNWRSLLGTRRGEGIGTNPGIRLKRHFECHCTIMILRFIWGTDIDSPIPFMYSPASLDLGLVPTRIFLTDTGSNSGCPDFGEHPDPRMCSVRGFGWRETQDEMVVIQMESKLPSLSGLQMSKRRWWRWINRAENQAARWQEDSVSRVFARGRIGFRFSGYFYEPWRGRTQRSGESARFDAWNLKMIYSKLDWFANKSPFPFLDRLQFLAVGLYIFYFSNPFFAVAAFAQGLLWSPFYEKNKTWTSPFNALRKLKMMVIKVTSALFWCMFFKGDIYRKPSLDACLWVLWLSMPCAWPDKKDVALETKNAWRKR